MVGSIHTKNDDSIYSKLYPYPMRVADFVNGEIRDFKKKLGRARYFTTIDLKPGFH